MVRSLTGESDRRGEGYADHNLLPGYGPFAAGKYDRILDAIYDGAVGEGVKSGDLKR